jgi:FG-GAP repeat
LFKTLEVATMRIRIELLLCLLVAGTAAATPPEPYTPTELLGLSSAPRTGQFGSALASYADALVVGAPNADIANGPVDAGTVYIHHLINGHWDTGTQILLPPIQWRQANMHFGAAVAMFDDRLLIGAPDEDISGKVDAGAVYFFRRDENGFWQLDAREETGTVQAGERLGAAVALTFKYAAAGAPGYNLNSNTQDTGRLQMFRRTSVPGGYLLDGDLKIAAPQTNDAFGSSVAIQDFLVGGTDRLFVGAPNRTAFGNAISGAAYCYEYSGGAWTYRDVIAPGFAVGDFVGSAIVATGEYVLVGARGRDQPGGPAAAGSVLVYRRASNGTYNSDDELFAGDAQASAFFGSSLAIGNDNRLVVGAPKHNGAATDSGRVYVFDAQTVASTTTWTQFRALDLGEPASNPDALGTAVAIGQDHIFAGAPRRTVNGFVEAGRVQVYGTEQIFADGFE